MDSRSSFQVGSPPRSATLLPGHFQTTFDDKNGYQHLKIHPDSQGFFSFSWRGYYSSFCTLPFGWKASAFLYQNFGLIVTSAARSLGVPVSQYIDDRHVGQLFSSGLAVYQPCHKLALAAAFILLSLLVSTGTPSTSKRVHHCRQHLLGSWVLSPIPFYKHFWSLSIRRTNSKRYVKNS